MTWVDCAAGLDVIRIDASLAQMALPRVHVHAFLATATERPPALVVERSSQLSERALVAEGPLGRCRFELDGDRLGVEVADGVFLGELVLRLAWYVVATRRGGVLVHAAAVTDGERALVVCGKSGDGKSTFSRLCRNAGLTLLTDEIVQLFPDGTCAGTPFRSDDDNVGTTGVFPTRFFWALQKSSAEDVSPLLPIEAAQLAAGQCFDGSVLSLPRIESHRRLLSFLGRVELGTLAFRKHPDAGRFVRERLAGTRR